MDYKGTRLKDEIVIDKLYTVHYFEYTKWFKFTGERHDFWEFVYADKGDLTITADDKEFVLKQGSIVFHKPNEWHNVYANTKIPPNVTIVTFGSNSESIKFFEDKVFAVGQEQKTLISRIVAEYINAFSTPLNDIYTNKLKRRTEQIAGSEQLIKMYLCQLLLSFIRNDVQTEQRSIANLNLEDALMNIIYNYMNEHIAQSITVNDICAYAGINKTTLEKMFKTHFNMGAIEYFIHMKIELAKRYLRDENHNITQIAEMLGYSGIHYFSRQFKKVTYMTPTQYLVSIKSLL